MPVQKYLIEILLFIGNLILTLLFRFDFLNNPDEFNPYVIIYIVLLYLAGVYEISVVGGKKQGFSKYRIIAEVFIVWIVPLISGLVIAAILAQRA